MSFFLFKQKTAYELRISDWSSDVCSSDLDYPQWVAAPIAHELAHNILRHRERLEAKGVNYGLLSGIGRNVGYFRQTELEADILSVSLLANANYDPRSEEHTSELQSLMRISYAVFCLKKKKQKSIHNL